MKSKANSKIMAPVNIGEASKVTGISQKMVRHYESLGLLAHPPRTDTGYRLYNEDTLNTLHFIRRARDLGFGIPEIAELLDLWRNRRRSSATVKKMAQTHINTLQQRIDSLQTMKRALDQLVKECHGDDRATCPILDDMASGGQAVAAKRARKQA